MTFCAEYCQRVWLAEHSVALSPDELVIHGDWNATRKRVLGDAA